MENPTAGVKLSRNEVHTERDFFALRELISVLENFTADRIVRETKRELVICAYRSFFKGAHWRRSGKIG